MPQQEYIRERVKPALQDHRKGKATMAIVRGLPFYRKGFGLVHRVRSGQAHFMGKQHSHSSVRFWCGNTGFIGCTNPNWRRKPSGTLFQEPPENSICCAICEGKATGAGLNGARVIAGRPVLFSPRI